MKTKTLIVITEDDYDYYCAEADDDDLTRSATLAGQIWNLERDFAKIWNYVFAGPVDAAAAAAAAIILN